MGLRASANAVRSSSAHPCTIPVAPRPAPSLANTVEVRRVERNPPGVGRALAVNDSRGAILPPLAYTSHTGCSM
jgi:hypothetical protein